jgi:hypothetical protein
VLPPDPPDPPLGEIVDVCWLKSIVGGFAYAVPADNAESTVSMYVAVAVFPFPSVTVKVTVNGDPVVSVGVQMIEPESELLHPSGRPVHA